MNKKYLIFIAIFLECIFCLVDAGNKKIVDFVRLTKDTIRAVPADDRLYVKNAGADTVVLDSINILIDKVKYKTYYILLSSDETVSPAGTGQCFLFELNTNYYNQHIPKDTGCMMCGRFKIPPRDSISIDRPKFDFIAPAAAFTKTETGGEDLGILSARVELVSAAGERDTFDLIKIKSAVLKNEKKNVKKVDGGGFGLRGSVLSENVKREMVVGSKKD